MNHHVSNGKISLFKTFNNTTFHQTNARKIKSYGYPNSKFIRVFYTYTTSEDWQAFTNAFVQYIVGSCGWSKRAYNLEQHIAYIICRISFRSPNKYIELGSGERRNPTFLTHTLCHIIFHLCYHHITVIPAYFYTPSSIYFLKYMTSSDLRQSWKKAYL